MIYSSGKIPLVGDSVVLEEHYNGPKITVSLEIHGTLLNIYHASVRSNGMLKNVTIKKTVRHEGSDPVVAFYTPDSNGIAAGQWLVDLAECNRQEARP